MAYLEEGKSEVDAHIDAVLECLTTDGDLTVKLLYFLNAAKRSKDEGKVICQACVCTNVIPCMYH